MIEFVCCYGNLLTRLRFVKIRKHKKALCPSLRSTIFNHLTLITLPSTMLAIKRSRCVITNLTITNCIVELHQHPCTTNFGKMPQGLHLVRRHSSGGQARPYVETLRDHIWRRPCVRPPLLQRIKGCDAHAVQTSGRCGAFVRFTFTTDSRL